MSRPDDGGFRFGLNKRMTWWEDPLPDPEGKAGPHGLRWALLSIMFLLPFLYPVTQSLLAEKTVTVRLVLLMVLVYGYALCYAIFPVVFNRPRRVKLAFGVSMLVMGLGVITATQASPFVLLYGTATLAFMLPAAWAVILDGGTLLIAIGLLSLWGRLGDSVGDLISVASVTLAMFFMANLVRAIRRLERANTEIAVLAVTSERERVARDLHDLLGHSLTTITVKAGLARRVLESSGDIPRAVEEIREVEGLTRSALSDVRATVSEYREVSLSAEIVGARAALRAAEIEADLPHAVDNVAPEFQNTFGYVLREAVTNVLRHSGASRVKVKLGRNWLEIEDDGTALSSGAKPQTPAGGQAPLDPPTAANVKQGNGLRGLGERLAAIEGTLTTSARPGGGLVVRAEVPEPEAKAVPAVRAQPAGGLA